MYCFILLYKFYNFVILIGLLLFVFGVDNEIALCRLWHTSRFYFRQINALIILNILKYWQNKCQVWKWANCLFPKLYGLGFANATFHLSSFKLLVLFTSTWLLFTLPTFYSTSSSFRHHSGLLFTPLVALALSCGDGVATRYILRRNNASIMKIWFLIWSYVTLPLDDSSLPTVL